MENEVSKINGESSKDLNSEQINKKNEETDIFSFQKYPSES